MMQNLPLVEVVEPGHGSHIVLPELGATVFVGQGLQIAAP